MLRARLYPFSVRITLETGIAIYHLAGDAQTDTGVAIDDALPDLVRQVLAPAPPHRVAPGVSPEAHLRVRRSIEAQLAHPHAGIERDVRVLWRACSLLLHLVR